MQDQVQLLSLKILNIFHKAQFFFLYLIIAAILGLIPILPILTTGALSVGAAIFNLNISQFYKA